MKEDKTYYQEAQATLRSYDQKLWLIPGLFFVVVGFIFENIEFSIYSVGLNDLIQNVIILFIGISFLLILILLYNKAHIFHVLIQKKINDFDDEKNKKKENKIKRIALTSMTPEEFKERIDLLKEEFSKSDGKKGAKFDPLQKFLAERTVSTWIRWIMITVFILTVIALVFSVYTLVYSWQSSDLRVVEETEGGSPSINLMSSVAEIYCADSDEEYYSGSGSVWSIEEGKYWLITNEHLLEGMNDCYAYFTLDWMAVAEDNDKAFEEEDIIEYRIDTDNKKVSPVAGSDLAWALLEEVDNSLDLLKDLAMTPNTKDCKDFHSIGTEIKTFGYPETGSYDGVITVTEGIISSFEKEDDAYYYLTSAKLDYGSSGGLAFVDIDKDIACVVGIPSAFIGGEAESLGRILVLPESRIKDILK